MTLLTKRILLTFFFVIFLFIAVGFVKKQRNERFPFSFPSKIDRHRPLNTQDLSYVSSWMTFDYLNKVFNLPFPYLKDSLSLNDKKYPFITIKQYADKNNLDINIFTEKIKDSIRKLEKASSSIPYPHE